jgi:hypothetical protein
MATEYTGGPIYVKHFFRSFSAVMVRSLWPFYVTPLQNYTNDLDKILYWKWALSQKLGQFHCSSHEAQIVFILCMYVMVERNIASV